MLGSPGEKPKHAGDEGFRRYSARVETLGRGAGLEGKGHCRIGCEGAYGTSKGGWKLDEYQAPKSSRALAFGRIRAVPTRVRRARGSKSVHCQLL